jgi:hypothetical protein
MLQQGGELMRFTFTWSSFQEQTENWDDEENGSVGTTARSTNYYFKAVPYTSLTDYGNQRSTYFFCFCVELVA